MVVLSTEASMRLTHIIGLAVVVALVAAPAQAQVKGHLPATMTPPWTKGIQPITRESYWHAIECGKQPGARPVCVFYDAELCKNDEFTLAMYTPYKQVAYTVWQAVSHKQPAPTPSFAEAQRTRIIIGLRPQRAAQNPVAGLTITRGGKTIEPSSRSLDEGAGTFYFDFAPFAPTASITLTMAGQTKTVTCEIDRATLARMR
jgi:hypothetical protein